jgi:transposase
MNTNTSLKAADLPIGAYIGWDWADKKHDICLRLPGDKKGTHQVVKNTPEAIHGYLQKLHEKYPQQQIVLAIEATRSALVPIFEEYASWLTVYEINPGVMSKYREVFYPSKAKNDGIDCSLLADIVIAHPEQLTVHIPKDAQSLEIETLAEDRRKLVDRRTAFANDLKSRLKCYFPQALDFIHNDTTESFAAEFLLKWPSLEVLQKASPQDIRQFYLAHRHRLTVELQSLITGLPKAMSPTKRLCRVDPAAEYAQSLARILLSLNSAIDDYDRRLKVRVAEHPTLALIDQLPGAGAVLSARLVAVLGQATALQGLGQALYTDADELAVITGVAPVIRSSGNSKITQRRRAFSQFPHQTFIEYAKESARYGEWAKAFVAYKIAKGWKYWSAIRALAYKWIRILVAVLRSGEAYDESKYIKRLVEKNCPYMIALKSQMASVQN